jgi:hypothetical protein
MEYTFTQYNDDMEAPKRYRNENFEDMKIRLISENKTRQEASKKFEQKKLLNYQQLNK